jgi:NADH-quinone oxidoreductase E subunit
MGSTSASGQSIDLSKLEPVFKKYEDMARGSLIPVLQGAQDTFGYLPLKALDAIAKHLQIPISQIYGVVTFYAQFRLNPRGKHIIRSCQGTACHVRNSARILESLKTILGVKPGGTTEDLKFTLETVACIGCCSLAPVMMIDTDAHGRLRPDRIPKILDSYSN